MVSRARTNDRRVLPRDEHIARGLEAANNASHRPFRYSLNVKSGTSRTRKIEVEAYNRLHAFAQAISDHAEEGKDLFAWNVSRTLHYQAAAKDY